MSRRSLGLGKSLIIITGTFLVAGVPAAAAVAHEGEDHSVTQTQTTIAPRSQTGPSQKVEAYKSRLAAEVERRLQILRTLHQRVGQSSELSTAHKNTLANQISQEVQAMEALKLEVAAATTIDVLSTLASRLASEFKVYALLVPKANLLRLVDRQLVTIEKMEALALKIQTRIDVATQQKQDVGALPAQMITVTQALAKARQQAQQAELVIAALAPTDLANDRKVLQGYHQAVKDAHKELMQAVRLSREMVAFLAKLPPAGKQ